MVLFGDEIVDKRPDASCDRECNNKRNNFFRNVRKHLSTISNTKITVNGAIAPGPDYKLYLTNEFTQHEDEFLPIKDEAKYVAEVKSFENFVVDVPSNVDVSKFNTVVIWCESFSEFITAAKYQ